MLIKDLSERSFTPPPKPPEIAPSPLFKDKDYDKLTQHVKTLDKTPQTNNFGNEDIEFANQQYQKYVVNNKDNEKKLPFTQKLQKELLNQKAGKRFDAAMKDIGLIRKITDDEQDFNDFMHKRESFKEKYMHKLLEIANDRNLPFKEFFTRISNSREIVTYKCIVQNQLKDNEKAPEIAKSQTIEKIAAALEKGELLESAKTLGIDLASLGIEANGNYSNIPRQYKRQRT